MLRGIHCTSTYYHQDLNNDFLIIFLVCVTPCKERKEKRKKRKVKKKRRNIPMQNNYIYQSSIASIFVCFSLKAHNIILVCRTHQSWLFSGHKVIFKGCGFCFLQNYFMYTFSSFGPCFCIDSHWAVSHFVLLFATCHLIFTVT